jgi:hypothetical protein
LVGLLLTNIETLALAGVFEHKCAKVLANARVFVLHLVTIEYGEYFTNTLSLALSHAAVKGERLNPNLHTRHTVPRERGLISACGNTKPV